MITAAQISRDELGLPLLNLNDHVNYYVSSQVFGAQVSFRRQTVQSPWIEGQFTVGAVRDVVQDKFAVEVMGPDQVTLQNNLQTLIAAFTQDYYDLTLQMDTAVYTYACEQADYTLDWTNTRFIAQQVLVTFAIRRSPVAINGV